MLRSLVAMFRWIDIRILYGVMAVVVVFYMLINRRGYRAIRDLFRRRLGYGRWRTLRAVYRNHYRFGQIFLTASPSTPDNTSTSRSSTMNTTANWSPNPGDSSC